MWLYIGRTVGHSAGNGDLEPPEKSERRLGREENEVATADERARRPVD